MARRQGEGAPGGGGGGGPAPSGGTPGGPGAGGGGGPPPITGPEALGGGVGAPPIAGGPKAGGGGGGTVRGEAEGPRVKEAARPPRFPSGDGAAFAGREVRTASSLARVERT